MQPKITVGADLGVRPQNRKITAGADLRVRPQNRKITVGADLRVRPLTGTFIDITEGLMAAQD